MDWKTQYCHEVSFFPNLNLMQPHSKSLQVIHGFQQKDSKVYMVMQKN
jgi:hypothetical protein